MTPTTVAVVGATGRMGRSLVRLVAESDELRLMTAIGRDDVGRDASELAGIGAVGVCVESNLAAIERSKPDVIVDFSSPAFTVAVVKAAIATGASLVTGTTGLDDSARAALTRAAETIAVLSEPNTSIGVLVLGDLLRRAITLMGDGVDIEIVETHHRHKVDAPSGTALRLLEIAESTREGTRRIYGREGKQGAPASKRDRGVRCAGGDVIGDHSVFLLAEGERIELAHRATNRDVFAHGALRAARWLAGREAGRYTLRDVVGLD